MNTTTYMFFDTLASKTPKPQNPKTPIIFNLNCLVSIKNGVADRDAEAELQAWRRGLAGVAHFLRF